ncbi:MAG: hypothetical protein ACI93R_004204, partial [Flavobacteriales bacterium]
EGDLVFVQVLSADTIDTEVEATLTIGDEEATFVARTSSTALVIRDTFKGLTFSWDNVDGAVHYRLLEKAHANDEFIQIAREFDSSAIGITIEVPIHQLDWVNAEYVLETCTNADCSSTDTASPFDYMRRAIGYLKASNTEEQDNFGAIALSSDGATLAVGAPGEDGASIGMNGDEGNNSLSGSGAVYIYVKEDGLWRFQSYVKSSNPDEADAFGTQLTLSGDGNTLAISAPLEDSASSGVDGAQQNEDAMDSGAVYVYRRAGDTWVQQNYLKSPTTSAADKFGSALSLSSFGASLIVSAIGEDSNALQQANTASNSGAVYLYTLNGDSWSHERTFKAPNADQDDQFGLAMDISANGKIILIGAPNEAGASQGLGGDIISNEFVAAGAAYLYEKQNNEWSDAQYIKASNTAVAQQFGRSISIAGDGNTFAIGAIGEASIAIGINGDSSDTSNPDSGAAYIYSRVNSTVWTQEAYVKASNGDIGDFFGHSISLNADGTILAVGAIGESSPAEAIDGNEFSNTELESGAAYIFKKEDNVWSQLSYVKSPNTDAGDLFGSALQLDASGDTLVVGAPAEQGSSKLFENQQSSNALVKSGAVYLF